MSEAEALTAYCGLYCGDCIPSHKELFSTVSFLEQQLEDLQFEHYAALKASQPSLSEQNGPFNKYQEFLEVLKAISNLECKVPCRTDGGYKGVTCKIRNCAIAKNLQGCWNCDSYQTCDLLEPLKKIHTNLEYHLNLIKERGINNWAADRKAHYRWQ